MNSYILLLGLLLCIVAANARHVDPVDDSDDSSNIVKSKQTGEQRHRRKRYHMSYGYDYQQPPNPFYHPYRREHDRNQDLLPEIYRLLDEISIYIRRPPPPPPPPQPIYIPYAVPYPVCNCATNNESPSHASKEPNITSRFPSMDDTNQNWGIVDEGTTDDDDGDGARDISFLPIHAKRPMKRPQIALDHGTQHERAPAASQRHIPDMCDVFSLSCCSRDDPERKKCFIEAGCSGAYDAGDACNPQKIAQIIDEYSKAYAPTN